MKEKHLLLIRLSALGDIVMLLPVVRALRENYPELPLTVLSQPFARPFFEDIPGVTFFAAELRGRHHGIRGLWRLAGELKRATPLTHLADTHSVIRSWLLRFFLALRTFPYGYKSATLHKGRREKKALVRQHDKQLMPLEHSVTRYAEVLKKLGFPLVVSYQLGGLQAREITTQLEPLLRETRLRVGIAPFAKHRGKRYDLDQMLALVKKLHKRGIQIFLFGSRGEEQLLLERWVTKPDIVVVPALGLNLLDELRLMRHLDLMVAMDSANMHLASWAGTRVLSVWGATHPYAGFYGWGQDEALAVGRDDLACRPCSVYGNKPCLRGDYACLDIPVDELYKRALALLPIPAEEV